MMAITSFVVRKKMGCFLVLISASMFVNYLVAVTSNRTNLSSFNVLMYYFWFRENVQHYFGGTPELAIFFYILANIAIVWLIIGMLDKHARYVGWILLFLYILTIVPFADLRRLVI
jgi:hypothetical protein